MARRFATSFTQSMNCNALGTAPWNPNNFVISGAAGGIHVTEQSCRLYLAPACYSEVRKVVFWAVIRHEYTGASTPVNVRLRVAPSSTSATARAIDSQLFPSGMYNVTGGGGSIGGIPSIWTINRPTAEAAFYDAHASNQNSVATIRYTTTNSQGSQMIYQEFDRFDASDAAFYNDWDSVAATEEEDRHVSYTVGVQRTDGVAWLNSGSTNQKNPIVVACGFAIVQAPSTNNRTRIYIPSTFGFYPTASITTSFGGERGAFLYYNAAEWSGEMETRFIMRQIPSAALGGFFQTQVFKANAGGSTVTQRYVQSFGTTATFGGAWLGRSSDFFSSIVDGDPISTRSRNLGSGSHVSTWGFLEVTLRNFNVMSTFFGCGHPPITDGFIPGGTPAGGIRYGQSAGLFDPLWFEDMESFRFTESKVRGGILHLGGTITSAQQRVSLNAQLDADVSASILNVDVLPECATGVNVASQWIFLNSALTANNLINLAGVRKLTEKFTGTWVGGSNDFPGTMKVAYVVNVPNTEVVELGPLFDVGSFDAEGCAATSAGLGDNPAVLVITNGSSIPQKFNPNAAGSDAEIEDAGIPVPFEGETPQAVPSDAAASPQGGLGLGIYKYRYTFRNCCTNKESDPNPDDIEVDTSGQSPAAQVTFSFAGVRIPSDPQICEICLYRTLEGGDYPVMAKVGCFNVDDTSIFVDTKSDDALDFTNDGLSILNAPMPCVSIVVEFRNRLFGMGDIPNLAPAGTVSVANGSEFVFGDGDVQWSRCLEGKFIKIGNDCRAYEIAKVLPPEIGTSPALARLKLVDHYEGTGGSNLTYVICGRPNRLYFSEPLEPEYWPALNFLDVEPGDGDRIMGAVSNFDRLIICKRNKTYVLTFTENPGTEVIVPSRISSDVGCIAPRSFAQVEVGSVWLADRGVALYDGRTVEHIEESNMMNGIFIDPDNPNYIRRDRNGRVVESVGAFYPKRQQYLLLLPTKNTNRGCDMMLVWDTKLRNITLLKFCQEFLSMTVAKDTDGNQRVYLGDTNGFVWIYDIGDTDGVGVPNATGTVRGTVTFAGVDSATGASVLDDSSASFITGGVPALADLSGVAGLSGAFGGGDTGLAGVCVFTRRRGADYDDPWTQRTIYAATETRLYVTPQWGADTPFDSTGTVEFEYMLGPIGIDWIFKPQNYGTDDMSKRDWRQIVVHEIEDFASQLRVDLLPDFQFSDPEADTVTDSDGEAGAGRVYLMDYSKGRQVKPVGRNIHFFMGVRMRNFAPEEPIRVINHLLCVVPRTSK